MQPDQRIKTMKLPLRDLQLPAGEVHLWHLDMHVLPDLASINPQASADRLDGNRQQLDPRQLRLQQRFYLRLLLAAHLQRPAYEVRIGKTANGKPYVLVPGRKSDNTAAAESAAAWPRPPLYFSLSHVGTAMLVALCRDMPVGVDMEAADRAVRDPLRMARRYFHPAEVQWLQSLPATEQRLAFMRLWTCKEAVVKATGGGIVSGLDRFAVSLADEEVSLTAAINEPEDDVLHSLRISTPDSDVDMLVAVAHHADDAMLRSFRLAAQAAVTQ